MPERTTNRSRPARVRGQPSWTLASPDVALAVTRLGGQMAPVTFHRRTRRIAPFSVAPWAEERPPRGQPAVLTALRGDFFCLPFGGNDRPWRGEHHPIHGETANATWRWVAEQHAGGVHQLHLRLRTRIRPGTVGKTLRLVDGHHAVYVRHEIRDLSGPLCPGHHAMLRFPGADGSGVLATSRFVRGQVFPGPFEQPASGGYQALRPGARFETLGSVPALDGSAADLTRYPARAGFEDLVMLVADPALPFAWNAVTFPRERYAWFALRDPRLLAETVLWLSNGGRHYPPWNGRHRAVMGIEDVTAYFHAGLAPSARRNPVSAEGHPTCLRLRAGRTLVIPYIMGVAVLPARFGHVADIRAAPGGIVLRSGSGRSQAVPLDLGFLAAG